MSLKDTLKKAKQLEKASHERQQISDDNKNSLSNKSKYKGANVLNISASRAAIKPRNYLALNPLLQKGGVHEKDDVDIVRKKRRRETKQHLRQTDWLSKL